MKIILLLVIMLKKLITYNLTLVLCVLFFLFTLPPFTACAVGEGEAVGTVPRILFACGDQNALYQECTLGNALADAMVKYTGADMAIINGGMLTGNLQYGDVTRSDIAQCIAEDCELAVAEVTAAELYALLESSVAHVVIDGERNYVPESSEHEAFPHISGFRVSYDPSAVVGERVARVTVNNEPIEVADTETTYTLISSVKIFNGEFGAPKIENYTIVDETLYSVFESYIRDGWGDEYTMVEKRVYAMGVNTRQDTIRYTILIICAIALILLVLIPKPWKKYAKLNKEDTKINNESEEIQ